MTDLTLSRVFQTRDYESPFSFETPGFTEGWWFGHTHRLPVDSRDQYLSFELAGDEVARAHIDPEAEVDDIYVGLAAPDRVVDIALFEVRSSLRLHGIGRAAIELIKERFEGRVLVAFSEEADGFWSSVGWSRHPRRDTSALYRPLFVFNADVRLS